MSGLFLISSRPAFLPPLAAEKARSHSFNSARRSVAARVAVAILHDREYITEIVQFNALEDM